MRYDDEDDFDIGPTRSHRAPHENPTSAGMIGFIFALVSAGLLVVVAVLWYFLQQEDLAQQNIDRKRWMLYWFLFLDLLSFIASILATVLSTRGMSATNPLYRGWGAAGLILGILEIVVTILFGLFMTCAVFFFEAFNRR